MHRNGRGTELLRGPQFVPIPHPYVYKYGAHPTPVQNLSLELPTAKQIYRALKMLRNSAIYLVLVVLALAASAVHAHAGHDHSQDDAKTSKAVIKIKTI